MLGRPIILSVLLMTLCSHIMAIIGDAKFAYRPTGSKCGSTDTAAYTQTDPLGGSAGLGLKCDIYECLFREKPQRRDRSVHA